MTSFPQIDGFLLHGETPLPDRTQYLIGKLIPMTGVGLLVGDPTTGKTFLTIGMAASIASGAWFLRQYIPASSHTKLHPRYIEGGATMIIAGEGINTYPSRLEAAYQGLSIESQYRLAELGCEGHLPIWCGYANGLREDAEFEKVFEQACELAEQLKLFHPFGLRLIVIDTLPAVFGFRDENSAAEAQAALSKLVRLSEATGAFVLATMHPRKKSGNRVRGSSVFEGSPDVILTVTKSANGNRKLTVTKSRANATENESWAYRLCPIKLPNGETSAFVNHAFNPSEPATEMPTATEGTRLTQDAKDVLQAIQNAVQNDPISWPASDGSIATWVNENSIRVELEKVKAPNSTDPYKRKDAERHTYKRGMDRLLQGGLIEERSHTNRQKAYRPL